MPGPVFLAGDRLSLRTVTPEDHEFLVRHWNASDVRHGTAVTKPMTAERVETLLNRSDAVHFLPCHSGGPVGFVWLFDIDDVAQRAELGYWIARDERGVGYGTHAAELAVRYAFAERGLRKVSARVFETNDASRQILETLGFEREGCLREHYYADGDHLDAYLYSLLDSEWGA
jgi:RimJ/RimL family protein N-acetyltransferase